MAAAYAGLMTRGKVAAMALAGAGTVAWLAYKNKQAARCWTSSAHLKFPASANYPDLSQHNNTMAKFLTPGVSCPVTRVIMAVKKKNICIYQIIYNWLLWFFIGEFQGSIPCQAGLHWLGVGNCYLN